MKVIIHGGANQIGGNCVEVVSGDTKIIIDIGIPITNEDGSLFNTDITCGEELLAKGIIPSVNGLYKWDGNPVIDGILISHYHLDHYGWLRYVHPDIPCYLGQVSHKMMNMLKIINKEWEEIPQNPVYINSWKSFSIGNILITPYLIDHSACDSYIFLVEADGKRIVYTGDFRSHGRKRKLFKSFLKQCPLPVDLLLVEGTAIGDEYSKVMTEEEGEERIFEICKNTEGFVFGFSSTQNIDRIVSFYKAALRSGRTLVIDPYQAYVLDQIDGKVPKVNGSYKIRVSYHSPISNMIADAGNKDILYRYKDYKVTEEEMQSEPGKYLLLVRNTMLGSMERLGNLEGAKLIYSMWQGYKEGEKIRAFLRSLEDAGVIVEDVHSSGHASFDTVKELLDTLKPAQVVPIHTEHWEIFENFSDNVIEPRKGLVVSL